MGANLSSPESADFSADLMSKGDQFSAIVMGVAWAGSLYGIGMIWGATTLLTRWAGPHGERGFNIFSMIAAFILSAGWPIILIMTLVQ